MKFQGDLRNHLTIEEVSAKCSHLKVGDKVLIPAKTIDRDEDCTAIITRIYTHTIEFLLPFGYKRYLQKFDCMDMHVIKKGELHTTTIEDTLTDSLAHVGEY